MSDVNLNIASFPKWNAAVTDMRNGVTPARIAFCGDSTVEGVGATTIFDTMPQKLQALLDLSAETGAVWGASTHYANPGVTLGTGWALFNGGGGWGPASSPASDFGYFTAATSAPGNLSFPITQAIDRIVVYYISSTSSGTVAVDVDGGATLGSVVTLGPSNFTIAKQTIACAPGVHTVNLHPPTVGTVFIMGVEGYLSSDPPVLCSNAGTSGTNTADWSQTGGNAWEDIYVFDLYRPDLTIVSLGINDAQASTLATTVRTRIEAIVTAAQVHGDVLIVGCVPSQNDPEKAFELTYIPAMEAAAVSKACGYYDMALAGRFVNWVTANGNGYMTDAYHPNDAGYNFWAGLLSDVMTDITESGATPSGMFFAVA